LIAAALGGVALVGLAAFLFARASAPLSANKPAVGGGGVLSAPPAQTAPAPVLSAPQVEAPKAPVIAPPATVGNPMPADVADYLRWLKQFEMARRTLKKNGDAQLQTALVKAVKGYYDTALAMSDPDAEPQAPRPEENFQADIGRVLAEWNQAASLFTQRRPPDVCAPLAAAYRDAIAGSVAQMSKIQGVITQAQNAQKTGKGFDMSVLQDMNRQKATREGSRGVDTSYGGANQALNELRSRYTAIPPDINASAFDIQEGGMAQIPAIPGMPGGF
jgi:hypothetical protein